MLSLKDKVYNAILEDIIALEYHPGQILNEKQLIDKYKCSKSPVREALMALCAENVLRNLPRYGYEVIRLTRDDIYEMMQFRLHLESGMLKAQYDKFSPIQIERLEAIDQTCQHDSADIWAHWAHNTDFHIKLIGFCGNSYAMAELERCMKRLKRAYAQFYLEKTDIPFIPTDTRHHALIIEGLKTKNLDVILSNLIADLNDFGGLEHNFIKGHV